MAGTDRRTKNRARRGAKSKKRALEDWRMEPEFQRRARRYGAFLKKHYPLEKMEQVLEELGI